MNSQDILNKLRTGRPREIMPGELPFSGSITFPKTNPVV